MGVFLQKVFFNDKNNSSKTFMKKLKGLQNISGVFAFMFVREPYSRLFSAYENKLFHPNKFWRGLGTDIIREVRHNASKLSKHLGHDVTFTELIEYVVKLAEQGRQLNEHLAAMHTMCNPCRQHFDFVGKLETMTEDLVYLVHKWKTRGILSNDMIFTEDVEAEIKYERSLGRIRHMFLTYENNLHLISKYKLFQRTWSSYQIRGMILNDYKMPFDEFNISHVDMKLYTQAVESAMDNSKSYENELKTQRKEALLQAYRTIPAEQMDKLRQFVKTDCVIYGYDDRPELLFKRSVSEELRSHDYFKWL
ncbi:carbohydrate sulfotransferase 8-like [Mercenaria mercenaria]|uniref:carbohydrate sulfotransferase 8-like n=1 Tax=Mercenaria mercenaria TaxID=6596 RepID=UPI00234F8499|nr:carbohydrate sulfotransferase 8-like [Mercenaria mercenaria]